METSDWIDIRHSDQWSNVSSQKPCNQFQ